MIQQIVEEAAAEFIYKNLRKDEGGVRLSEQLYFPWAVNSLGGIGILLFIEGL